MDTTKLLLQDLFLNYSKDVIPVKNQSKPITVYMDLSLVSINDFDEVAGTIAIVAILHISWKDESLVWNTSMYGNTTLLTFPQTKLWLPEMFLLNPVDSNEPISNTHFKVTVANTGNVLWLAGGLFKATCTPDISKFPFDQHTCTLDVSPWGFSSEQVTLVIPSPTIHFPFYSMNSEWDVIGSNTTVWSDAFPIGKYSITIKRRYLNFVVSVVIPIIMLALVNPFVFVLPFDSGERASYSMTVLLAFTVYMTVVSDRMPASSFPISYLAYYILSMLTSSVLIVIVNIFQTRTYGKDDAVHSVPRYISRFITFFRWKFRSNKIHTKEQSLSVQVSGECKTVKDGENVPQLQKPESLNKTEPLDEKMFEVENKSNNKAYSPTWYVVAKIADMVYFAMFSIITVVVTIALFVVITS
ncbi:acetylcholine receptor subunit alpha-like [Pecten maximus]|uniref:acetylcholine receptor subunit alpha-like n=1 Tax=Pecten maximus TaxID=6579 RepID=UPI0014583AD1|nr:acetylcholine receptor subunit alpha-like [Pecten maximus]